MIAVVRRRDRERRGDDRDTVGTSPACCMQAHAPARACKPALHADTPTGPDRNLFVLGHTVATLATH